MSWKVDERATGGGWVSIIENIKLEFPSLEDLDEDVCANGTLDWETILDSKARGDCRWSGIGCQGRWPGLHQQSRRDLLFCRSFTLYSPTVARGGGYRGCLRWCVLIITISIHCEKISICLEANHIVYQLNGDTNKSIVTKGGNTGYLCWET